MDLPLPSRRLSLLVLVGCGLTFVVLAALLVPWSWVPHGQLRPVAAGEIFSGAQLRRMEAYSGMQRHLGWASLSVSMLLALVLGLTRAGAAVVRRLPGPWWLRTLLAVLALGLAGELATLPFALRARSNALRYGLTNQALPGWLQDRAVSLLVSWVLTGAVVVVVVGLARRSPRRWPAYAALVAALFTVVGSWLYPVVVEPLFNTFTPLPRGALRSDLLRLAEREHVPVSDVLVSDASRRTTTLNAYVSGIGSTRRIVLYDTLVTGVPREEARLVVAHELGHARYHDVAVGTALGAFGAAAGMGLLGLVLSSSALRRRAGVPTVGSAEVVPLLLALVALGSLLSSPVQNTISRAVEARADRASLSATGDLDGFVAMQKRLAVRSLSDPTPPAWSQFWFGSHPTTLQRIGLARGVVAR